MDLRAKPTEMSDFRITENQSHIHDFQATIMHWLGFNHEKEKKEKKKKKKLTIPFPGDAITRPHGGFRERGEGHSGLSAVRFLGFNAGAAKAQRRKEFESLSILFSASPRLCALRQLRHVIATQSARPGAVVAFFLFSRFECSQRFDASRRPDVLQARIDSDPRLKKLQRRGRGFGRHEVAAECDQRFENDRTQEFKRVSALRRASRSRRRVKSRARRA